MNLTTILLLVIVGFIIFEFTKHLLFKKTAKVILVIFLILILFLTFSYFTADQQAFRENKAIQTGAAIAESIDKNLDLSKYFKDLNTDNLFKD